MIIIIEQFLPHYRVELYHQISEKLRKNFILYYGNNNKGITYPEPSEFRTEVFNNIWYNGVLWQSLFSHIIRCKNIELIIIRGAVKNLTIYPLLLFCKIKKIPIIFWGQGYSRKRLFSPKTNIMDWFSLQFYKLPDAIITYTEGIKEVLTQYGIKKEIFVANNTIDNRSIELNYNNYKKTGKDALRQKHLINTKYVLIFVGRLHKRKRLDYLIEIFDTLQREHDIEQNLYSLFIIGEGEEKEHLKSLVSKKKTSNIFFKGELYKDEVDELIYISDIFLMPGWVGLGVNHSFMLGTPIITELENQTFINHAPEVEFIIDNYNGRFVEKGDKIQFINSICAILANIDFYSQNALATARNQLSIESMVNPVIDCISKYKTR